MQTEENKIFMENTTRYLQITRNTLDVAEVNFNLNQQETKKVDFIKTGLKQMSLALEISVATASGCGPEGPRLIPDVTKDSLSACGVGARKIPWFRKSCDWSLAVTIGVVSGETSLPFRDKSKLWKS